jgi:hypothetical protein
MNRMRVRSVTDLSLPFHGGVTYAIKKTVHRCTSCARDAPPCASQLREATPVMTRCGACLRSRFRVTPSAWGRQGNVRTVLDGLRRSRTHVDERSAPLRVRWQIVSRGAIRARDRRQRVGVNSGGPRHRSSLRISAAAHSDRVPTPSSVLTRLARSVVDGHSATSRHHLCGAGAGAVRSACRSSRRRAPGAPPACQRPWSRDTHRVTGRSQRCCARPAGADAGPEHRHGGVGDGSVEHTSAEAGTRTRWRGRPRASPVTGSWSGPAGDRGAGEAERRGRTGQCAGATFRGPARVLTPSPVPGAVGHAVADGIGPAPTAATHSRALPSPEAGREGGCRANGERGRRHRQGPPAVRDTSGQNSALARGRC